MFTRAAILASILLFAQAEYVRKKTCNDVDVSQCAVHSVIVDPCTQGPSFCIMKTFKNYVLTVNMTPRFSASKVKMAVYGDVQNNGTYTATFRDPYSACDLFYCPMTAENIIFDVGLTLNKQASGKFPVKFKIWDEADESKACCFTFTVKVK